MNAPTFTHAPRAPMAPLESAHQHQRYFGWQRNSVIARFGRTMPESAMAVPTSVNVYRDAREHHAELRIRIWGCDTGAQTYLTPAELRELARELIDAAHDIESAPISSSHRPAPQPEGWP